MNLKIGSIIIIVSGQLSTTGIWRTRRGGWKLFGAFFHINIYLLCTHTYVGVILGFVSIFLKWKHVLYIFLCLSFHLGMHSRVHFQTCFLLNVLFPYWHSSKLVSSVFTQNLQDKNFLLFWLQQPWGVTSLFCTKLSGTPSPEWSFQSLNFLVSSLQNFPIACRINSHLLWLA